MKQIFPLKTIPCVYYMIIWTKRSQNLVSMLHLCNCFNLLHFVSLLTRYTVAYSHAFVENGPKLADWSKWVCITLRSCFCSLLTSNWEVSTGRSPCSFISFDQITQNFVLSSFIKDIAANLPFRKHILRVFTW